ncbi:TraX family protein [uncultured Agathobaculum sp.]|uniref:TraX family protein n=1 Tax=uncultured Agathobaculum sp. TaxID=2048140 RepID=UPI003207DAA4
MQRKQFIGLSQNQIKMIAAAAMVLDHVGMELFPQWTILRIIGRLAFPVFSYCIWEGSRRTHHPWQYLFRMLGMGLLCVAGYYVYTQTFYGNILITFSLSLCVLYAFQYGRTCWAQGKRTAQLTGAGVMLGCVGGIWLICHWVTIDYGFLGVMLPLLAELAARVWEQCSGMGCKQERAGLIGFSVGLLALSLQMGGIQIFSLLTIPLLLAYNGTRGEKNLKQFFYWFYPVHLLLIGLVSLWI